MTHADAQPAAAPPHDIAAEQAVIGSMMLNDAVIADVSALLRPGDFYRPIHATIFTTILDMFAVSEPTDMLSVLSRLIEDGNAARVGGAPYLASCAQFAVPASALSYARTVADRATDRAVGALGAKAALLGATPGDTERKVSIIREDADALAAHREIRHGTWIVDAMIPAINAIEDARNGTLAAGVVPTPYRDLNRMLGGGLRPGQSVVIGARPGIGKSTALLDLLRCAARMDVGAELISLEMSVPEIMQRYLSAETGIPYSLIRTGQLNADDEHRLTRRLPEITDRRLRLTDAPGADMGFARSQVRRGSARDQIRVFGLDYIGLMGLNPKVDRRVGLGEISRGVKRLALENGVIMITASQLNRNPAARRDKRPDLADLRETGDIEQDADIVILIHDPTDGDPMHARTGETDFIVAKHRGGPTGTVTVANQQHRARFADIAIV